MQAHREISPPGRILASALGNASGITLIEVLICSLVVGIGAVALAFMFANGQTVIAGEGDNRVAVYLAQQKIEQCRREGFGTLPDLTVLPVTTTEQLDSALQFDNTVLGPVPCYHANPITNANPFYTRTTTIDCVPGDDYSGTPDCTTAGAAKRVAVTVQSNENTRTRNATLRAVLANPNP